MTNDTAKPEAATLQLPPGFNPQFRLVRATDQLDIGVELRNLVPIRVGDTFLFQQNVAGQPTGIIVTLPPQHILEYAFGKPSRKIVADPTRLVFVVTTDSPIAAMHFSVEGILFALRQMTPNGFLNFSAPPNQLVQPPSRQPRVHQSPNSQTEFCSAFELVRSAMAGFVPFDGSPNHPSLPANARLLDLAQRAAVQFDLTDDDLTNLALATDQANAQPTPPLPGAPPVPGAFPLSTLPMSELRISSRLVMSPWFGNQSSPATCFQHPIKPATHDGRTELWHTDLVVRTAAGKLLEKTQDLVVLKAEEPSGTLNGWKDDVVPSQIRALSIDQAKAIAAQTKGTSSTSPPLRVKRAHLTPHGATMEVRGDWPNSSTVKAWRHRTAIGRDQYERVVELGRLYPFGHAALKTSITERKIVNPPNGSPARLLTRTVIEVLAPTRDFNAGDPIDRQFPFAKIELLSLETPEGTFALLQGDAGVLTTGSGGQARPFRYRCLAMDRAGRPLTFDVPLVFVPNTFSATEFTNLANLYKNRLDLSQVRLGEQTVAVATPGGTGAGGSTATTTATPPDATEIIASLANLQVAGTGSNFRPVVSEFTARVPGIERFTAVQKQLKVAYEAVYLNNGFTAAKPDGTPVNPGEVLLKLVETGPVLGLASQAVNGNLLSGVSFPVTGLSRKLGPVGGVLADVAKDVFNPQQWLGELLDDLTLLGIVPLKALIKDVSTLAEAPVIAQSLVNGLRTQTMRWSTPLFPKEKFPANKPQEIAVPGGFARLRAAQTNAAILNVEAVVVAEVDGNMTATTTCTIHQVALGIGLGPADLVEIPFTKIAFISVDGRKPDLDVEMGEINFLGILAFLGVLTRLIDKGGFHDPPALDITADGIRSSFSTPIPNVAVGMFSLENIAFGAALDVPFKASAPELFLNFATFDNPFRLTVSAIGGGGYLGMALSASSGLVVLEGALEFGASLSINLGVAKGSVSVMGGIYFRIEAGDALLTGYVRIAGYLSVLGLISVSVEFMLALSYETQPNIIRGEAELTVKVSVLFFSKTVRIHVERSFAGANADPTFAELMDSPAPNSARPWDAYCLAYAA